MVVRPACARATRRDRGQAARITSRVCQCKYSSPHSVDRTAGVERLWLVCVCQRWPYGSASARQRRCDRIAVEFAIEPPGQTSVPRVGEQDRMLGWHFLDYGRAGRPARCYKLHAQTTQTYSNSLALSGSRGPENDGSTLGRAPSTSHHPEHVRLGLGVRGPRRAQCGATDATTSPEVATARQANAWPRSHHHGCRLSGPGAAPLQDTN